MTMVSFIGKKLIEIGLQFRLQSSVNMMRSMVTCRQTQCWREGAESSISESAGRRNTMRCWAWVEHLPPQSPSPVTHFLQKSRTNSNKATLPNCAIPYGSIGPFQSTILSQALELEFALQATSSDTSPPSVISDGQDPNYLLTYQGVSSQERKGLHWKSLFLSSVLLNIFLENSVYHERHCIYSQK